MTRKDHDRLMKPLCEKLNALIPIKSEKDRDKINALIDGIRSEVPDFCINWDRELFINCNGDDEKMRSYVLHSGIVHFEPSDDPTEHPGVVVRYIPNRKQSITAEQIKEDLGRYDELKFILKRYTEELQKFRDNKEGIDIDSVSYYIEGEIQKQTLAFFPRRSISAQVVIDAIERHIKDIECEMECIKDKYKGIIDFED